MFQYVLFDLDGTLTDPKEGITKSVQFALLQQGIHEPDLNKLEPFIGPPLKYSFMDFYGMTEEEAAIGVADYRKRFAPVGIFENKVYPGILELLENLQKAGIRLAVASSKPEPFVRKILEHFSTAACFDVVVGSGLDGSRESKEEVVEEALRQLDELCGTGRRTEDSTSEGSGAPRDSSASESSGAPGDSSAPGDGNVPGSGPDRRRVGAMVGDRKFDISGGKEFGLTAVGVAWGYAGKGELEAAGADYIAKNVKQLEKYLLSGGRPDGKGSGSGGRNAAVGPGSAGKAEAENISGFAKTWNILLPFILYYIGSNACYIVLMTALQLLTQWGVAFHWLQENRIVVSSMVRIFSLLGGAGILVPLFRKERTGWPGKSGASCLTIGILAGTAALGINILFGLLHITDISQGYGQVSEIQHQIPLLHGILLYGIVSPLAEEMLFRGLIYNRMKRYFSVVTAAAASSVLFGIYHGNLVQGLYGALLGLLIVYTYEMTGNFIIPVFVHGVANIVVFVLTYDRDISEALFRPVNCGILLLIAALSLLNVQRRKKKVIYKQKK